RLFPEYELVEFRKDIQSEHGVRRPDFALIHKKYRTWWVVEVEMSYHSLYGHVIPQVLVFSNGTYGSQEAEYLVGHSDKLIADRVEEMMKGAPPRVLVVANELVPDWLPALRAHNSLLAIVEVYRSDRNEHLLR